MKNRKDKIWSKEKEKLKEKNKDAEWRMLRAGWWGSTCHTEMADGGREQKKQRDGMNRDAREKETEIYSARRCWKMVVRVQVCWVIPGRGGAHWDTQADRKPAWVTQGCVCVCEMLHCYSAHSNVNVMKYDRDHCGCFSWSVWIIVLWVGSDHLMLCVYSSSNGGLLRHHLLWHPCGFVVFLLKKCFLCLLLKCISYTKRH